jgi:TonB family protein
MSLSAEHRGGRLGRAETANDRLKAGRQATLHRAIVASVVFHFAVVVAWPEMTLTTLGAGGIDGAGAIQLVSLGDAVAPGPLSSLAPRLPRMIDASDADQPVETPSGADGQPTDASAGAPAGWENRSAELWRLAALRPRVTEQFSTAEQEGTSETENPDQPRSDGESREGLRIRQGTEDLEYQRLSEEELLSLERLSALRPELVLVSPSSWLIVRNPDEVGRFIQARFADHGVEVGARGSLSVSLWVDERGSVEWAEINRSSGNGVIDASALELFRDVVSFRPAREEGMRVPVAAIFWLMW